jgi:hypothetical protein
MDKSVGSGSGLGYAIVGQEKGAAEIGVDVLAFLDRKDYVGLTYDSFPMGLGSDPSICFQDHSGTVH